MTYIVCPILNDVFEIPESSISHDMGIGIEIDCSEFEQMTQNGSFQAEKILEIENARNGVFSFKQVIFVKLANGESSVPLWAWASRVTVNLDENTSKLLNVSKIGKTFLFLWNPVSAFQAFTSCCEKNRRNNSSSTLLHRYAPSISTTPSTPGTRFGPRDILGTTPVALSQLTASERFFLSFIKPKPTQFLRRRVSDSWSQLMEASDHCQQQSFRLANPAVATQNQLKLRRFWIDETTTKTTTTTSATPSATTTTAVAAEFWFAKTTGMWSGFDTPNLPTELTTQIFATALAHSLSGSAEAALATIFALRATSKSVREIVDGFLGVSLAKTATRLRCLLTASSSSSPLSVGRSIRALGLTPAALLRICALPQSEITPTTRSIFNCKAINHVPRWESYVKERLALSAHNVVAHELVTATQQNATLGENEESPNQANELIAAALCVV